MSTTTSSISIQVDADIKRRANEALADIGLSMSDAIRIFLHRVAEDQQFPWELKVPNAETRLAMECHTDDETLLPHQIKRHAKRCSGADRRCQHQRPEHLAVSSGGRHPEDDRHEEEKVDCGGNQQPQYPCNGGLHSLSLSLSDASMSRKKRGQSARTITSPWEKPKFDVGFHCAVLVENFISYETDWHTQTGLLYC